MTKLLYSDLRKINVNEHTEKKGKLTYLSWAWAVHYLLEDDPSANWKYGEPKMFGETMMVFCSVTAFGKTMTAQLPVLDYQNKAIKNPDAMAVNTAMQRCLAKAIALHGVGLYIYSGEDLPLVEVDDGAIEEQVLVAIRLIESSETIEELKTNYFPAADTFKSNPEATIRLATSKNKRKGELA
jgi:hypothetical protein